MSCPKCCSLLKPLYTRAPAVARGASAQAQVQRRPAAGGAARRAFDDEADGADGACVRTGSRGPQMGSVVHTARRLPASCWYPSECTQKHLGQHRATSSRAAQGSWPVNAATSRAWHCAAASTSAALQDVAEKTAVLGSQGIASAPGVVALGAVALGAGVVVGALVGVCAAACEHSRRRHAALAALAALAARV